MEQDCGPSVLVVEDDERCRALIVALLRHAGLATCAVATGEEALAVARRARPNLVVLDVHLPRVSGYEVCRQLRDEFGDKVAIVFVSGVRKESLDIAAGLLVGGDDYVVKPFSPDELLARVRLRMHGARRGLAPPSSGLTKRELQVLQLLAEGRSQHEIAGELVISAKTVSGHIQRILAKLDVHSRAQAVAHAYRNGLLLDRRPRPDDALV